MLRMGKGVRGCGLAIEEKKGVIDEQALGTHLCLKQRHNYKATMTK